jgi:hypothetical protein
MRISVQGKTLMPVINLVALGITPPEGVEHGSILDILGLMYR